MRNYAIKDTRWKERGRELDKMAEYLLGLGNDYYIIGKRKEIENFCERGDGWKNLSVRGCILLDSENEKVSGQLSLTERNVEIRENTIVICVARERRDYEEIRTRWLCRWGGIKGLPVYFGRTFFNDL